MFIYSTENIILRMKQHLKTGDKAQLNSYKSNFQAGERKGDDGRSLTSLSECLKIIKKIFHENPSE